MKELSKKNAKRLVHWTVLGSILGSFLLVAVFAQILDPSLDLDLMPWALLSAFTMHLAPCIRFWILFSFVTMALIIFEYWRWFQKEKKTDKLGRALNYADYQPYGNAHFENPEEYRSLAQIRPIEKAKGIILGRLSEDAEQIIDLYPDPDDPTAHINTHMFGIGASGSGKTFTLVKSYCYQTIKKGQSLIITDPKGELYRDMAAVFRRNGFLVKRLNFCEPMYSDGWDAMAGLRGIDPIQQSLNAATFADAIASNITEKRDIYYSGPKLLLNALIVRLILDPTIPENEKTLKKLHEWVSRGKDGIEKLFDTLTMPAETRPSLQIWRSFVDASPNLSGNIITHVTANTSILNTEIIADVLSTNEIDVELAAKRPCAYFIQFPVDTDTYRFPLALFFTMAFTSLIDMAIRQPKGRLPIPVHFLLDEFPQLGVLPTWPEKMSVVRSYGINITMISQTLSQFKRNYREGWETIISNCATWLLLGANDLETANYFSERIGKASIEVQTEQREGARKAMGVKNAPTARSSVGVGQSSLLSPDMITKLPPNRLIIVLQRHDPILAMGSPHTIHPLYRKDDQTYNTDLPTFYEKKQRKILSDRERQAADDFVREHPYADPYKNEPISDTDEYYAMRADAFYMIRLVIKEDIQWLKHNILKSHSRRSKSDTAPTEDELKTKEKKSVSSLLKPCRSKKTDHEQRHRNAVLGESISGPVIDIFLDDIDEDEDEDDIIFQAKETPPKAEKEKAPVQVESDIPSRMEQEAPIPCHTNDNGAGNDYHSPMPQSAQKGSQALRDDTEMPQQANKEPIQPAADPQSQATVAFHSRQHTKQAYNAGYRSTGHYRGIPTSGQAVASPPNKKK